MRDGATLTPWVSQPRFLGIVLISCRLDIDVLVAHAPVESSRRQCGPSGGGLAQGGCVQEYAGSAEIAC